MHLDIAPQGVLDRQLAQLVLGCENTAVARS